MNYYHPSCNEIWIKEVLNILTTLKSTYEEYNTKLTELLTDNTKSAEEKRIEYLLKFLIQLL